MSIFNSVGTPLVILMIILMIGGAIFGTSIAGADYLNPATSQAEASRLNAETNHAQAIYEQQERILQAETDTQVTKLNVDASAYQEQVAQNLAHQMQMQQLEQQSFQRMSAAKEQIMIIVGYSLGLAMILAAMLLAGSRILLARSTKHENVGRTQVAAPKSDTAPASLDPWRLPQYRQQMVQQARENEKIAIQAIKNGKFASSNRIQTMTEAEYRNLPLAQ